MHRILMFAIILLLIPGLAFAADNCANLTGLQVAAGFVTTLNVFRIMAIVLGVVCVGALLREWLIVFLMAFASIPLIVYEIIGYGISFSLMIDGHLLSQADQIWPVLVGCLLFAAMLGITGRFRNWDPNFPTFFGLLFVVWAIVAIFYHSPEVGSIAVMAFMGMLGFSAAVIPMGYVVGFQDGLTPRATAAAGLTLAAAVVWRVFGPAGIVNPFQSGALWVGSFAFFLGLLIMASRWYFESSTPYLLRQVGPIVFGVAAIIVGNMLGLAPLAGIGGTFFVLYVVEKMVDIPARSVTGYATIGLLIALFLGTSVWWGQHHMDVVRPYLLF